MDQRTIEAIQSVIDYLYDDEHEDYMEQDEEGRENHVYNSIVYLDNLVHEVTSDAE